MTYSHGVFPLVYNTLKIYDSLLPNEKLSYMKKIYMDIVKENMLMTSELIKVMKLFEENDIKAIPFKGPVLSQVAYGDVVSRQYVDLDILIKVEDIKETYEVLKYNGFISTIDNKFIDNKLFLEKNSDITFVNNKNNTSIEIHWKLFRNKFSSIINDKIFLEVKKQIKIHNHDINIFNYELLLVYLCMHGSKHKWERIEWITDIDKLLNKKQNIDWKIVFEIAKEYNCTKMLKLGLYVSKIVYNTMIPEKYLDEIRKESYQNMINYIFGEMLKINNSKDEMTRNLASVKFQYNLYETFYEKIRFLKKTFLEISDNDTTSFNSSSVILHYIVKPFRLLKKYI